MPEYLTTSEVARHLRLNQKKIYALITSGDLPAARVSGKWLFPKDLVDAWVAGRTVNRAGGVMQALLDEMLVLQGSDDWLLSRVVDRFQQRSGSAIPSAAVGSVAGLSAVAASHAHLATCHISHAEVRQHARFPIFLLGLFGREQGIVLGPTAPSRIEDLRSLCRRPVRFAERQANSGTARLVERLVAEQGTAPAWTRVGPFSSHLEVAIAVRDGRADAGVAIRVAAHVAGLKFVPLMCEEFELAIPANIMSHDRVGAFVQYLQAELSAEARNEHPGYTFETLGRMLRVSPAV
jgi:excisionase family DNA binding protein